MVELDFNWKAMRHLQEISGKPYGECFKELATSADLSILNAVWRAARFKFQKLTEEEADNEIAEIADKEGFEAIMAIINKAMSESGFFKKKTLKK